jgi:hypothetical protein
MRGPAAAAEATAVGARLVALADVVAEGVGLGARGRLHAASPTSAHAIDARAMSARAESDALHERVQRFITDSLRGSAESFDLLACDIARFQARHIEPVRRLMRAHGSEENFAEAARIPAIPTDVFRLRRIAAHAPSEDVRVFQTSGTTGAESGRHAFRRVDTYVAAAMTWAQRMLWPDQRALRVVLLAADETRAPHSSLSFMLARFGERWGGASHHWDGDAAVSEPILIAGASFAFVPLFDARRTWTLPAGSRVMFTGGFKGRTREIDPDAFRAQVAEMFSIPRTHVVGEYGMTELSSQLYQAALAHALGHHPAPASATAYYAPPWLCASAVDPITLAPLPAGREGICRIVDLANVDSAVAIQTADRVVAHQDGSIELLGRMPGATPRGCSLAVEQALDG